MKSMFLVVWIVVVLAACSITIKNDSAIRKMNINDKVEAIEEFIAYPSENNSLDFATNKFFRFNHYGEKLEEIYFSETGEITTKLIYLYNSKGKLQKKETFDAKTIKKVTEYLYKNGKLSEIIVKNKNGELLHRTEIISDSLQYEYDENEKIKEIKTERNEGNIVSIKNLKTQEITTQIFDTQNRLIEETIVNDKQKMKSKKSWTYDIQFSGYDEYDIKGYQKRIEKIFDEQGNVIAETTKIPTFKPEIDEIDWSKDYSLEDDVHFNPKNYKLITAETKNYEYKFDEKQNWIQQKKFINNQLKDIRKREITYY